MVVEAAIACLVEKVISEIIMLAGQTSNALVIIKKLGLNSNKSEIESVLKVSFDRAQKSINLNKSAADALISDETNQIEYCFWIINDVANDQFESRKGNLKFDYVMEQYNHESDKIIPFLKSVLTYINEYKTNSWSPEILEIISNARRLEVKIDDLQSTANQIMSTSAETASAINVLLENMQPIMAQFEKCNCADIQLLFDEGMTDIARERALERIKSPLTDSNMKFELYLLVSNTYINDEDCIADALHYLRLAVEYCSDRQKKINLLFYIHLFSGDFTQAETNLNQQVISDGYTEKIINEYTQLYIKTKDYLSGYSLAEKIEDADKRDLCIAAFNIVEEKYDNVIFLFFKDSKRAADTDWQIQYIQALIYGSMQKIESGTPFNLVSLYNTVSPIIESLMSNGQLNGRLKLLSIHLLYVCDKNEECKPMVMQLFRKFPLKYGSLLISVLLRLGDTNGVITICEEMGLNSCTIEEKTQYLVACIESQMLEKAEAFLAQYLNYFLLDEDNRLFVFRQKLVILSLRLDSEGMKQVLNEVDGSYPTWPGIYGLRGYASFLLEDWDIAIECFEKHIENSPVSKQRDFSVLYLVRSYIQIKGNTKYDYLVEIIPSARLWYKDPCVRDYYVNCLYMTNKSKQIIALFEDADFPRSDYLGEAAAATFFNYMWFEKAHSAYSDLYCRKKKLSYAFQMARCKYYLGQYYECSQITSAVEKKIMKDGSPEELMLLSGFYVDLKSYIKCLQAAYRAYIISKKSKETCKHFFAVNLICKKHILPDEYDAKWSEACNNIFKHELKPIRVFNVADNNGEITENSLQEMADYLRNSSNKTTEILSVFRQFSLPCIMLSMGLGRGPYETWEYITKNSDYKVVVDISSRDWINRIKCFQNGKLPVILDLASIFSLFKIGAESSIGLIFSQIYVSQDQFGLLLKEYKDLERIDSEGKKSIYCQDGKLHIAEVPLSVLEDQARKIEKIISWIQKETVIIGRSFEENIFLKSFVIDTKLNSNQSCGEVDFESIIDSAISIKAIVVLDSAHYCNLISTKVEVVFINVLDIICCLREKEYITNLQYALAIVELYYLGYYALPINAAVILTTIQSKAFSLASVEDPIFNFFEDQGYVDKFRTNEAGRLICILSVQEIDNNIKKEFIKSILSKLYPQKKITEAACMELISGVEEILSNRSSIIYWFNLNLIQECLTEDEYEILSEEGEIDGKQSELNDSISGKL